MVADINEPLEMPYDNIFNLVESPDCVITVLELMYRDEGVYCISLLDVCISSARSI